MILTVVQSEIPHVDVISLSVAGILPPDSRTGFCWDLQSSPGGPLDPAATGRSVGPCAGADGHRTWRSAALPPGAPARSPRSWAEPGVR